MVPRSRAAKRSSVSLPGTPQLEVDSVDDHVGDLCADLLLPATHAFLNQPLPVDGTLPACRFMISSRRHG
jgi:hypothetical protein